VYFTDRGIEELEDRRADDSVTLGWLAERLREFVDLSPESEATVDRLATWLARFDDDPDDPDYADGTGRTAAPEVTGGTAAAAGVSSAAADTPAAAGGSGSE
jgi:Family of unknown function (DUF6104)